MRRGWACLCPVFIWPVSVHLLNLEVVLLVRVAAVDFLRHTRCALIWLRNDPLLRFLFIVKQLSLAPAFCEFQGFGSATSQLPVHGQDISIVQIIAFWASLKTIVRWSRMNCDAIARGIFSAVPYPGNACIICAKRQARRIGFLTGNRQA